MLCSTLIHYISGLQRDWVNEYHGKCREVVGAELERQGRKEALEWLIRETQPIVWSCCPEVQNGWLNCSANDFYLSHLSLCLTSSFFCKAHHTSSFNKYHLNQQGLFAFCFTALRFSSITNPNAVEHSRESGINNCKGSKEKGSIKKISVVGGSHSSSSSTKNTTLLLTFAEW